MTEEAVETPSALKALIERKNQRFPSPPPTETSNVIDPARTTEAPPASTRPAPPFRINGAGSPDDDMDGGTQRIDGRSLRATGRTKGLSTRVTREFMAKLYWFAEYDRKMMVEVLEAAMDCYAEQRRREGAPIPWESV
jgi:hypothetical protein